MGVAVRAELISFIFLVEGNHKMIFTTYGCARRTKPGVSAMIFRVVRWYG
jgi:hypothetical protein